MSRSTRSRTVTELKIPAQAAFVIVAKRAAGALGSAAGFSLEGIDDLNIAVAQACEKAIAAGDVLWGPGRGILKLTFNLVQGGIEVEVRSLKAPAGGIEEAAAAPASELAARAGAYRQVRARAQLRASRRIAAAAQAAPAAEVSDMDLEDVAVNMIRLFVDELRYTVDS
jgi:hypothetical protein